MMVGVRDQQAAVRQHVQPPGLVEALELVEGASQRYGPQRPGFPDPYE